MELLDFLRGYIQGDPRYNPLTATMDYFQNGRASANTQKNAPRGIPKSAPKMRRIPKGLGKQVGRVPKMPGQFDPMSFFDSLGGGGGMSSADIDALLAADFGPRERALNDRYKFGNDAIKSMYAALAGDIEANSGRLGSIYDAGISGANSIAADSTGKINASYDAKSNEQANLLKTLGITEATPAVQKSMDANETAAVGNIEQGRAANTQALNAGKAASLGLNEARGDLAGMESKAAQAALYMKMMDQQAQLDSEKAEARAGYAEAASGSQVDPMDLFTVFKWQTERQDEQAALANKNMNPFDATYNLAIQRLGDPAKAKLAMNYIRQASFNMDEVNDAGAFAELVGRMNRDRRIPYDLLTSLAQEWYMRADPRQGSNVMNDATRAKYGLE